MAPSRLEIGLTALVSFLMLVVVLFGSNLLIRVSTGIDLETVTAATVQAVLQLLGSSVARHGTILVHGQQTFKVVTECTGLTVLTLVGTFIFAFPASIPEKLQGFLGAAALLFCANSIRIATLLLFSSGDTGSIGLIHDVSWPAFILILSCGYFYAWAVHAGRPRQTRS